MVTVSELPEIAARRDTAPRPDEAVYELPATTARRVTLPDPADAVEDDPESAR
jgi:hypothetical protein